MNVSLMLVMSLAATPVSGVGVAKRSGVNRNLALSRAELVRGALGQGAAVAAPEDFTSCVGKLPCLLKLARDRGWSALVLVETATVLGEAIVDVRLLSVDDDGKELNRINAQTKEEALARTLEPALQPMRRELERLTATAAPPVADVPPSIQPAPTEFPAPPPTPPPASPPQVEARPAPASSPSPLRWVPLAISVAVLAGGAVSFGLSQSFAGQLRNSPLSDAEIDGRVSTGKLTQTLGVVGMVAGGALAAGSLALALLWPSSPAGVSAVLTPHGVAICFSRSFR